MGRVDVARDSSCYPPIQVDVDALLVAVRKVFWGIEPWCQAISDDRDVDMVIQGARIQGQRFNDAIDLSVTTSEDGLMLLAESVLFSRATAQGKPIGEMQPDFGSLVRLANDGYERAAKSSRILSEVSGRFRELGSCTGPLAVRGITRRPDRRRQDSTTPQGIRHVARAMSEIMVGGVMPLITIPPELEEVTKSELGIGVEVPVRKKEKKNVPVSEALGRLEVIAKNVAEVQDHISKFIELWRDIKDKLGRMQLRMREGDAVVGEQLGHEVEREWADVVAQYKTYRDAVSSHPTCLVTTGQLSKVACIREYHQITFDVNYKEFGFKVQATNLREHVGKIRSSAQQMESIAKLTHSGEGRAQFQDAINSIREGLEQQLAEVILVLEEVEKSIRHSGGVSDADPETRERFCELLKRTESRMPSVAREIQTLGRILAEQVSAKRLIRAQVYQAYDWFSSSHIANVFSQEDAERVLSELGESVLGVSGFCGTLVIVGIQLDETSLMVNGDSQGGLEELEETVQDAIRALKLAKAPLSLDNGWDFL
ncbi:hypothetical protein P691DRAFT_772774 [Macrolepiota fuliginosa MF-IS2]|uniref:Uncharacterized protein n=1 Tax=Macrolepiota fuliginosa MF-IS2 TaxID=1400762 RepID=A0A9P5XMF2_9AGAR|nr:hypothetical protein P691DRAFT_772774 [Macrolepiota fuliginosa MF-IS2]